MDLGLKRHEKKNHLQGLELRFSNDGWKKPQLSLPRQLFIESLHAAGTVLEMRDAQGGIENPGTQCSQSSGRSEWLKNSSHGNAMQSPPMTKVGPTWHGELPTGMEKSCYLQRPGGGHIVCSEPSASQIEVDHKDEAGIGLRFNDAAAWVRRSGN